MSMRRFRKFSLRIALFVVLPLCAIGFWLSSRVMLARENVALYQSLHATGILSEQSARISDDDVWWETFWGGKPLASITVISIPGTEDQFNAIASLPNLRWLDLIQPVADVTATRIGKFATQHPGLKRLTVSHGKLTPETWRAISQIPSLEAFQASVCNITDADVREFENASLTEFELFQCSMITEACCQSVAKMYGLTRLSLQSLPIADQGVNLLGKLTKLEVLDLAKTQVSGRGLAVLRKMLRLSALSVSGCPINEVGFDHIESLRHLTLLSLDSTSLDDQRLARLTHMTELKFLSLNGTDITDDGIAHLLKLPRLRQLQINFARISDTGAIRLAGLKELRVLHCSGTYTSPAVLNRLGGQLTDDDDANDIMSIHWDGAACVDTRTIKLVHHIPIYPDDVSNTNAAIGSARADGVEVFPLSLGDRFVSIPGRHSEAKLSAAGDRLATIARGELKNYELPSGRLLSTTTVADTKLVTVSADKVITDTSSNLQAWETRSGQNLWSRMIKLKRYDKQTPLGPNRMWLENPFGLSLVDSDNGEAMLVGTVDGEKLLIPDPINKHWYGMDGSRPIFAHRQDERIEIYDLDASKTLATIDAFGDRVVMSPNAKFLAIYSEEEDNTVRIFDALSGEEIGSLEIAVNPFGKYIPGGQMRFTPDGRYLIVDLDPHLIDEEYRLVTIP